MAIIKIIKYYIINIRYIKPFLSFVISCAIKKRFFPHDSGKKEGFYVILEAYEG